jgi:hypothetical protein
MTTTRVQMEASKYNNFLKCVTSLKDFCNDVDIRNGFIRQRSNDRVSAFEVDLTEVIDSNANMIICDARKKLNLLNLFFGQDVTVEITEGANGFYTLSDQYTSIKFLTPTSVFVDNQYIEQAELERIFTASEEDLILHYDISSIISDRIKITTQNFNTLTLQIHFNGERASMNCATQSKDQFAKFVDDLNLNINVEGGFTNLTTIPFNIEHDGDIEMKIYRDPNNDRIVLNKFSTKLGDIPITIYSRSAIINEDDDQEVE